MVMESSQGLESEHSSPAAAMVSIGLSCRRSILIRGQAFNFFAGLMDLEFGDKLEMIGMYSIALL